MLLIWLHQLHVSTRKRKVKVWAIVIDFQLLYFLSRIIPGNK
jgi:hypothetical protein